jgi:hypothetical protein
MLLLGLDAGCSSLGTTPATPNLSGSWQFDAPASDDAHAKIEKVMAQQEAKQRARRAKRRGLPAGSAEAGLEDEDLGVDELDQPGRGGRVAMLEVDLKQLRANLQEALRAPAALRVDVRGEQVELRPESQPSRSYHPGEVSGRIDSFGAARIVSGWDGSAFVVQARYGNGIARAERYELSHDGLLILTLSYSDPTVGKLVLRSAYRRA